MSNPIYTQKQIQAILSKATELQQKSSKGSEEGLTLEELEQIAVESGIDPDFLHQAISNLDANPTKQFSWSSIGGETSVEMAKEFDVPLTEEAWESIVLQARKMLKKNGGTVQNLGNSREWVVSDQKFVQASLTASPKGNRTKVYINTSFGKVKFLTYYFAVVNLLIALGIGVGGSDDMSTFTGVAISLVSGIVAFGGARAVYGAWLNHQKAKVSSLLDKCKDLLDVSGNERGSLLDDVGKMDSIANDAKSFSKTKE